MVFQVRSLGLQGVSGYEVSAECDLSSGLPAFTLVGLPDAAVNEARERVRSAIKNCGFQFPVSRITVNLAPAHVKKSGTLYDLPILVGILAAGGQLKVRDPDCAFVGELSLSGELRPAAGILPMALARRAGWHPLSLRSGGQCPPRPPWPAVPPFTLSGTWPAGRHLTGEEPSPRPAPGYPAPAQSRPRLLRGEGAGEREAGPGDRRGRRPQPAHVRSSRVWQIHAGPPACPPSSPI